MSLCWGLTWFFLKFSLKAMPLLWGISMRFLIAGSIFWIIYFIKNERVRIMPDLRSVYIRFTLLNYTLCYLLTYWSTQFIYSNLGSILWSLFPIFVTGMAHIYLPEDRLNMKKSLSMAIGFIGTVMLLYNGESLGEGKVFLGIFAMLIAIIMAAWPNVYVKIKKPVINTFHLNAVGMSIAGTIMLCASLLFESGQTIPTDGANIFAILFLAIPGTVVTWGIFIWMLNHVHVSRLSYVAFFPPMVAILIGWIFLGESLSPISLVGAGLVITGGFLINYQSRSPVQSKEMELSPIPKD